VTSPEYNASGAECPLWLRGGSSKNILDPVRLQAARQDSSRDGGKDGAVESQLKFSYWVKLNWRETRLSRGVQAPRQRNLTTIEALHEKLSDEAVLVTEKQWNSDDPGAGAGSVEVYAFEDLFFVDDDSAIDGAYETFSDAADDCMLFATRKQPAPLPQQKIEMPKTHEVSLQYAPSSDDPDPPDYMTDEEIAKMADRIVEFVKDKSNTAKASMRSFFARCLTTTISFPDVKLMPPCLRRRHAFTRTSGLRLGLSRHRALCRFWRRFGGCLTALRAHFTHGPPGGFLPSRTGDPLPRPRHTVRRRAQT
jgi:hypothetical protein